MDQTTQTTGQIRNILLIKPGAIGDLLQLTPTIRSLADRFSGARISLLVGTQNTATLFLHNRQVSETIVFDSKGEHRSVTAFFKLWLRVYRNRYDLVIHFQRSNVKAWFLSFAAFPSRILVYHKPRKRIIHAVDNYLETLAPLCISRPDRRLELFTGQENDDFAEKLFWESGLAGKQVIALNPGASHVVNRWSIARFAALGDALAAHHSAAIIVVGGPEDRESAEAISQSATVAKPVVLAGKLTLLQLGAVLKRCTVLVSGDTGPMHLATAVGTRVAALFGAADPVRTGPVGQGHRVIQASDVSCVPCRRRSCANKHFLECMEKISVADVVNAVAGIMSDAEKH